LRLALASFAKGRFHPTGRLDGAERSGVNCLSRMRTAAKRTTDYLLVDISNSYTKLAFATTRQLGKTMRLPTSDLTAAALRRILRRRKVGTIVVSSVVPQKNQMVVRAAGSARTLFLHPKLDLGVGVDYPSPRSIGADRLANAAAVAQLYGYPAIVVDFGTAVTFDVVSRDGDYIGGVIAPGLEAMTNFLYQRTALLPRLSLREPKRAIGKTTRDAMMAGAVFGYRGLVREILQRITSESLPRRKPRVVATGGYAQLIARKLPEIEAVHPNLTLEGLRIIANRNAEKAEP
jgi:type III pantothenate kinase